MKNYFIKLFTLVVVFFLITVVSFAKIDNNTISKIVIEATDNDSYSLNMLFDSEYSGSAFIQKIENGYYNVFLPETITNGKKPQIIYKNKYDKSKIDLAIEEKPYVKNNKDSNYVKVVVTMADDYSLKLTSGLTSDYKVGFFKAHNIDIFMIISIALLAGAIYLLARVFMYCRENEKQYTLKRPSSYADLKAKAQYLEEIQKNNEKPVQRAIIPEKASEKKEFKQADKMTFDCFELPFIEDINTQNTDNCEFRSSLKQASKLLKEKPALKKLRHSDSLSKSKENVAELQMPAIEDVIQKKKQKNLTSPIETKKQTTQGAELLSVLNITPNKGFYLTTYEDTLALFGFINDNVFLFKKFNDLSQINLQARYYDKNGKNDIYIVRLDNYKAMIEISDTSMKELAKI